MGKVILGIIIALTIMAFISVWILTAEKAKQLNVKKGKKNVKK